MNTNTATKGRVMKDETLRNNHHPSRWFPCSAQVFDRAVALTARSLGPAGRPPVPTGTRSETCAQPGRAPIIVAADATPEIRRAATNLAQPQLSTVYK